MLYSTKQKDILYRFNNENVQRQEKAHCRRGGIKTGLTQNTNTLVSRKQKETKSMHVRIYSSHFVAGARRMAYLFRKGFLVRSSRLTF